MRHCRHRGISHPVCFNSTAVRVSLHTLHAPARDLGAAGVLCCWQTDCIFTCDTTRPWVPGWPMDGLVVKVVRSDSREVVNHERYAVVRSMRVLPLVHVIHELAPGLCALVTPRGISLADGVRRGVWSATAMLSMVVRLVEVSVDWCCNLVVGAGVLLRESESHHDGRVVLTLGCPVGSRTLRLSWQALEAWHGCGVVHGDIKPENIVVVTAEGESGGASGPAGRLVSLTSGGDHGNDSSTGMPSMETVAPLSVPECQGDDSDRSRAVESAVEDVGGPYFIDLRGVIDVTRVPLSPTREPAVTAVAMPMGQCATVCASASVTPNASGVAGAGARHGSDTSPSSRLTNDSPTPVGDDVGSGSSVVVAMSSGNDAASASDGLATTDSDSGTLMTTACVSPSSWDFNFEVDAICYTERYQPEDGVGKTSRALDWYALGKTIEMVLVRTGYYHTVSVLLALTCISSACILVTRRHHNS